MGIGRKEQKGLSRYLSQTVTPETISELLNYQWKVCDKMNLLLKQSKRIDITIILFVGEGKGDIEKGPSKKEKDANKPPTDEIIPVYRRDCHEEVYCGSHMYPGRGVYLLKFDNSYSLWRSKTLYYRVYYTR